MRVVLVMSSQAAAESCVLLVCGAAAVLDISSSETDSDDGTAVVASVELDVTRRGQAVLSVPVGCSPSSWDLHAHQHVVDHAVTMSACESESAGTSSGGSESVSAIAPAVPSAAHVQAVSLQQCFPALLDASAQVQASYLTAVTIGDFAAADGIVEAALVTTRAVCGHAAHSPAFPALTRAFSLPSPVAVAVHHGTATMTLTVGGMPDADVHRCCCELRRNWHAGALLLTAARHQLHRDGRGSDATCPGVWASKVLEVACVPLLPPSASSRIDRLQECHMTAATVTVLACDALPFTAGARVAASLAHIIHTLQRDVWTDRHAPAEMHCVGVNHPLRLDAAFGSGGTSMEQPVPFAGCVQLAWAAAAARSLLHHPDMARQFRPRAGCPAELDVDHSVPGSRFVLLALDRRLHDRCVEVVLKNLPRLLHPGAAAGLHNIASHTIPPYSWSEDDSDATVEALIAVGDGATDASVCAGGPGAETHAAVVCDCPVVDTARPWDVAP